jgi:DNA-binding MarR family transcriptional regulator
MAAIAPEVSADAAEALALATEVREGYSRLKRRLRAEGGAAEITPSQASALRQLHQTQPTTVSELAAAEGVRPQSMGATIAALQAQGFIAGAPDPADGRRTILTLSPGALDQLAANRAAWEGWLFAAIQGNLSAQEKRDLARGFEVLSKLLDS